MKKYLILIILLLAIAVILYPGQKPIGGEKDEYGCLIAAGYSWDEEVGACTRSWELDETEKQAARLAVVVQSFRPVTIVDVKPGNCEKCYIVTIQGESAPWDVEINLTRVIESISTFEDCVAAGYPVMESYPRQCRVGDRIFEEAIRIFCTDEQKNTEACTKEYNPVCGEILLNTGKTTYMTFGNFCNACSAMKSIAYSPGTCEEKLFVVCKETVTGFDPEEYANSNDGTCVDRCPENFDSFTTQTGIELCIPHYGISEIEQWDKCERSTDTCKCARAYETTAGEQIPDAEYRCVPEKYADRLLFRGGLDFLDENGAQAVVIA